MRTRRFVVGAFAGLLLAQFNVQTNTCVANASEDAMVLPPTQHDPK